MKKTAIFLFICTLVLSSCQTKTMTEVELFGLSGDVKSFTTKSFTTDKTLEKISPLYYGNSKVTFNPEGKRTQVMDYNHEGKITDVYEFSYTGNITKVTQSDNEGIKSKTYEVETTENGGKVYEIYSFFNYYDNYSNQTLRYDNDQSLISSIVEYYGMTVEERVLESKNGDSHYYTAKVYNEDKLETLGMDTISYNDGLIEDRTILVTSYDTLKNHTEYNSQMFPVLFTERGTTTTIEYDEKNNVTKIINGTVSDSFGICDPFIRFDTGTEDTSLCTYEYDERGNWTKRIVHTNNLDNPTQITEREIQYYN